MRFTPKTPPCAENVSIFKPFCLVAMQMPSSLMIIHVKQRSEQESICHDPTQSADREGRAQFPP